ncbi:mannose-1-phosphate guanylyltransferase [Caldicellulosiruptoraceae bacterium PP1]
MFYACILSGGQGTRLWPQSRRTFPKQFLQLFGNKSFLQLTYDRISKIIDSERIYIITHKDYYEQAKLQLPHIKQSNILIEPDRKETAACVGLVTTYLLKKDPKSVIGFFPSDHFISNEANFISCISTGYKLAEQGYIISFGIKATRPETNYGYIERDKKIDEKLYKVKRFIEKPDLKIAMRLIEKGFLWNSGIYIVRSDMLFNEIKKYLPNYYKTFMKIYSSIGKDEYVSILNKEYEQLEKISIDKAIMEKTKKLYVIEGDFDWDDIGTWRAFERIMKKDEKGNVIRGDAVTVDTSDCIFFTDKFVTSIGIKDIILVSADDAILICHKSRDAEIKDIIQNMILSEKYKKYV